MSWHLFPDLKTASLAILAGLFFGFLLRKALVTRFDTIVSQLLLRDFTVVKVIFTAIVVGSCGITLLSSFGIPVGANLSKTPLLFSLIGGAIFGVGMSLSGYCPGTGLGAIADGSKDMLFGLLGMIAGSIAFNELSAPMYSFLTAPDPYFQQTLPSLLAVHPVYVLFGLVAFWSLLVLFLRLLEKKGRSRTA